MTVMPDPARIPSVYHDCVRHGFCEYKKESPFGSLKYLIKIFRIRFYGIFRIYSI